MQRSDRRGGPRATAHAGDPGDTTEMKFHHRRAPPRSYGVPFRSEAHKDFCLRTGARRYGRQVIREGEMYLVEDEDGICHTDEVLRAASLFEWRRWGGKQPGRS